MGQKYKPGMFGSHILTNDRLDRMVEHISSADEVVLYGTQKVTSGRFGFGWQDVLNKTSQEYTPLGVGRYTVGLTPLESRGYTNNRVFIRSNYGGSPEAAAEATAISAGIDSDFQHVQAFALKYYLDKDEFAAEQATKILRKWTNIEFWNIPVSDTRLAMSIKWSGFIFSAMLLRRASAYTNADDAAMKSVTQKWRTQLSTAYASGDSNWAGWGCAFEMYCAVFLGDRAGFERAVLLWRKIFDRSVLNDEPWTETGRSSGDNVGAEGGISGIQYSNFFLNSMVRCAEMARVNGVWLYDHVSPDGSTMQGVFHKTLSWVRDWTLGPYQGEEVPSRNIQSHVIVLHNLWPNADSSNIVEGKPSGSGVAVGPSNSFQDSSGHSFTPLLYFSNSLRF